MLRYLFTVLALAAPLAAFEPNSNVDLFQVAEISGRERRADTTTSTDAAGVSNTITINYDTIDGSTSLTQTQLAKISEIISDAVLAADPSLAADEFVVFFDTDTGNFQARFVTGADPNVAGSALENDSTALDKTVEGLSALSGSSDTEFIEFGGESEAKINPVIPFCDDDDNSGSGKKGKGKKSESKKGKGKGKDKERRRRGSKSSRGSGSNSTKKDEADKEDKKVSDNEDEKEAKVLSNSTEKDKADKEDKAVKDDKADKVDKEASDKKDKEVKAKGTKGNSEDQGSGSGFDARSAGESSKKKAKSSKAPKASKSPKSSTKSPKANSGKGKTNCIQRPAAAGAQSGFAKNAHVAAASGFAIVAVVGAAVGATLYVRKSRTSVVDETSPLIDNVEVEVA